MAEWTIGDKVTGSNNVTLSPANFASLAEAIASGSVANDDTLTCIRNGVDLSGGADFIIDKRLTIQVHSLCRVTAPTYAELIAKAFSAYRAYVQIDGVVIDGLGFDSSGTAILTDNACTIKNLIMRTGSGQYGLRVFSPGSAKAINVSNLAVIVRGGGAGLACTNTNGTLTIYQTSILVQGASDVGIYQTNGTVNSYASIANGPGSCFSGTVGGDYNVSQDGSAPGTSGASYKATSQSGWFINNGSGVEDLTLHTDKRGWWADPANSKTAIDQTGWPSETNSDIVSTTRLGADIDPGVWQTPAAGGGDPPITVYNPNKMLIHPGMCGGFPD